MALAMSQFVHNVLKSKSNALSSSNICLCSAQRVKLKRRQCWLIFLPWSFCSVDVNRWVDWWLFLLIRPTCSWRIHSPSSAQLLNKNKKCLCTRWRVIWCLRIYILNSPVILPITEKLTMHIFHRPTATMLYRELFWGNGTICAVT